MTKIFAVRKQKYKPYCGFCIVHEQPNDPRAKNVRIKSKEMQVRFFINENFEKFMHDKPIRIPNCDCTIRRRPDHYKIINGTMLCIETDENQHKSYKEMDKEARINDLYMAYAGKWIYIRFNPDSYYITVNINGNNRKTKKNPQMKTRLKALKLEIEKQIKRIENEENKEPVERVYLYYDVIQDIAL